MSLDMASLKDMERDIPIFNSQKGLPKRFINKRLPNKPLKLNLTLDLFFENSIFKKEYIRYLEHATGIFTSIR